MSASVRAIKLYDLLGPEFFAGFSFPSYIDDYLSKLTVNDLAMASDDTTSASYGGGVLYTGTVGFPTIPGAPPAVTQHTDPSGAVFSWNDITFSFRLRTWREGSSTLKSVLQNSVVSRLTSIGSYFDDFAPASSSTTTSSDYPGLRFRLELMISNVAFHLGPDWSPGRMDASYHVVKDTTSAATDVQIQLPKITFVYEQLEDFSQAPSFSLASWGSSGFDAPSNLGAGELVTMVPPLALHSSGRLAFSVQNILLDLSPGNTPPELLSFFGIGDDFTGIYIKQLQFFYSDQDKDFAFNVLITDAVISFQGQIWLQAEVDLLLDPGSHPPASGDPNSNQLQATVSFLANGSPIQFNDSVPVDGQPGVFQGGSVSAPPNVIIQLNVTGGASNYTYDVSFTPNGGSAVALWQDNQGAFPTPQPTTTQTGNLIITVTDTGASLTYKNTMLMTVATLTGALPNGAPQDNPPDATVALATIALDDSSSIPAGFTPLFTPALAGTVESLVLPLGQSATPGTLPIVTITPQGGSASSVNVSTTGLVLIEVDQDKSVDFEIDYPDQATPPDTFTLLFNLDGPQSDGAVTSYAAAIPAPADPVFSGNTVPAGTPMTASPGPAPSGAAALVAWAKNALDQSSLASLTITGSDSNEGYSSRDQLSQTLSKRRGDTAQKILTAAFPGTTIPSGTGNGNSGASGTSNPADRNATIKGTAVSAQGAFSIKGSLSRAAAANAPAPQPQTQPAQTPPAGSNNPKPVSLKRLSLRTRLEKNIPVLLEVSGEIDFQQQSQSALQQADSNSTDTLGVTQASKSATANPHAATSVVDFTLTVTYDPATCNLSEVLTLGSGPADTNGLIQMQNGPAPNFNTFKNIAGSVMIFTPILNAAVTALDPNSAGEWTDLAISLAPPVAIGALGWINTSLVTLYGGTLTMRENVPSLSSGKFTSAALTFDYGVSFRIDIDPIGVKSTRDLHVRYNAFGFSLDFTGSPAFKFVLDTSKGYTLDLSDPGLFNLPGGLGDILKIAEARIAQFNPLTIEADLVMKVDLGVITVDSFHVKAPVYPVGAPMILPSGIHVNITDVLVGSGFVNIQDGGGFEGGFDLTLVPISLRVAASIGIEPVSGGGRSATAVYLGIEVDFPTPILLGDSGLGIFGLFGLFGMHYTRNVPTTAPGDVIGPDLQWLINAGGQPQNLVTNGNHNWVPQIGDWAFGLGALLGTDDGFLLTLRGGFILQLPGPQIIITVNMQILADLPGGSDGVPTDSLMVGMLGILDIDFNLGQITLGIQVDLSLDNLISIVVPISIFFSWEDPDTWHVWLGTISTPVSANILGIVKASGYFMIGGQAISPFPPGTSFSLPGTAVAVGFSASIIWGSEDINIYLEVVVGADLGVSFSPSVLVAGDINLSGKLELLIISIGASGTFAIVAPSPFYLHVKVCGSISFFFFSISACVEFGTSGTYAPPPPPLISQMYLQSYAPVIASGQGVERPIDASLGSAAMTVAVAQGLTTMPPPAAPDKLISVPIDTVPVLQFSFAADASHVGGSTFTTPLPQCPVLPTGLGSTKVSLGGGRSVTYTLRKLTIAPPLPSGSPLPPVVWRKNTSPTDVTATRVDLALFSRDPNIAGHALERSTTLNNQLTSVWGGLCTPIAPPACVLYTFCGQRLGPAAANGWSLTGIPWPDPPGTTRTTPPPTTMQVTGPVQANAAALYGALAPLFSALGQQPARVIGVGDSKLRCMRGLELPELIGPVTNPNVKVLIEELGEEGAKKAEAISKRLDALAGSWRYVRFDTGQARKINLYLAVHSRALNRAVLAASEPLDLRADNAQLAAAGQLLPLTRVPQAQGAQLFYDIVIRERDAKGALIVQHSLASLHPTLVNGTSGLPTAWTDPGGPWAAEVDYIAYYFQYYLRSLTKVFVNFAPRHDTAIIEIAEIGQIMPAPSAVVGVVEVCPQSEATRFQLASQVQQSQIQTLEGYLDGGSPVPLLAPNTAYTITVEYDAETFDSSGNSENTYTGVQQGFKFQTDSTAPAKLDPWVMSASPADQELNVFYNRQSSDPLSKYNSPVTIVFNDKEAIQLFSAYGDQLLLQLHAADGQVDPNNTVQNTTSVSGPGSAGYDSLLALIQSGKLPCVGATSAYQNQQFTADVQLRPCMAYTLDIVTNPAPAQTGQTVTPLYRTRFTTSKFATFYDLAVNLGSAPVQHRHLTSALSLSAPSGGHAGQVTDQDIQTAFLNAGEQALPAAADNAITIYWKPAGGGGPYVPYCLLIDCTEPVWRTRQEPKLVPVDSSDPSFNIVQITPTTALEVEDAAGKVDWFLYSPSGTRTIAMLKGGGQQTLKLQLHRPASTSFSLTDLAAPIITLTIDAQAPWENDHV